MTEKSKAGRGPYPPEVHERAVRWSSSTKTSTPRSGKPSSLPGGPAASAFVSLLAVRPAGGRRSPSVEPDGAPTMTAALRAGQPADAPAGSVAARRGAVSGLALKLSASAGTAPDRMGQDGRPAAAPAWADRAEEAISFPQLSAAESAVGGATS